MVDRTSPHDLSPTRRQALKLLGLGTLLPLSGAATPATSQIARAASRTSTSAEPRTAIEDVIVVDESTVPIGPGVDLTTFSHLDADGWVEGYLLDIDLDTAEVSTDLLTPGLTKTATVSDLVDDADATCGVNGDFFELGATDAPLGAEFQDSTLTKSSDHIVETTFGVDADGRGRVVDVSFAGSAELPDTELELDGLNPLDIPAGGVGVYTAEWEDETRAGAVGDASDVTEVLVGNGTVSDVEATVNGIDRIAADELLLVGRGASASTLGNLSTGDPVTIDYAPSVDLDFGLGGNVPLVQNGSENAGLTDTGVAPRTAAGVQNLKHLMFLAIDGRQAGSRGVSMPRIAEYMAGLGAVHAINLDGGGSTTMVARRRGRDRSVENNPSDGSERAVTNGVGVFFDADGGDLVGFDLEPSWGDDEPPRLFPGIEREFGAYGYDDAGDAVRESVGEWMIDPPELASVRSGTVTGEATGEITIRAERDGREGELDALVLGDLVRLETDPRQLAIADEAATFSVWGRDENGYRAPVAPGDVSVSGDEEVVSLDASDGVFHVTAETASGETTVEINVDDVRASVSVAVGVEEATVSSFDDPDEWTLATWPPEVDGSISFADDRNGEVLRLGYDFSTTEQTRAVYLRSQEPRELPGEPDRLAVWVDGDEQGAWLRCRLEDAAGIEHTLDLADPVDWTGWERLEVDVPDGIAYPIHLVEIYPVETSAAAQYEGELGFDALTALSPRSVARSQPEKPADSLIVQNDTLDGSDTHFAAIAGASLSGESNGFVSRVFAEIAAEEPDFLAILGNFVERGDYLDAAMDAVESALDIPVQYVPGPAERLDDPGLESFESRVGDPWTTFDVSGTRFMLLNSAPGSFRTADFEQLVELDAELAAARGDSVIDHFVVLAHHAATDPFDAGSRLEETREAEMLTSKLAEAASADLEVSYLSGRGSTVSVDRFDGVPHVNVGTLDPAIESVRAEGDARVWVDVHIGNADSWIRADVRPLLSDITLELPDSMAVGDTVEVAAIGHQENADDVPIEYPLTARWSGSENLFVGSGDEAAAAREDGGYAARFDPETRELEGLSDGEVTIRVESNGVSAEAEIEVGGGQGDDGLAAPGMLGTAASVGAAGYFLHRWRTRASSTDDDTDS